MGTEPVEFCREIETYLCRKNDGHLIRVTGPSFDLVAGWAARGVPLKIAFAGIDRYFERYYRNGPRRRPVKIDFCEADVLDVFDEWRRATGITTPATAAESPLESAIPNPKARPSLAKHLERVLTKLTSAHATGKAGDLDAIIDRVSAELDRVRAKAGGVRGAERAAVIERLGAIEAAMLQAIRGGLDADAMAAIEREASDELAPFRGGMAPDALARARAAAVDRLVRERFHLPTVSYDD